MQIKLQLMRNIISEIFFRSFPPSCLFSYSLTLLCCTWFENHSSSPFLCLLVLQVFSFFLAKNIFCSIETFASIPYSVVNLGKHLQLPIKFFLTTHIMPLHLTGRHTHIEKYLCRMQFKVSVIDAPAPPYMMPVYSSPRHKTWHKSNSNEL